MSSIADAARWVWYEERELALVSLASWIASALSFYLL